VTNTALRLHHGPLTPSRKSDRMMLEHLAQNQ
jgi:hypothetical protein